jgi:hypothetical protein
MSNIIPSKTSLYLLYPKHCKMASSIASAILNDGIVLPIIRKSPRTPHYCSRHPPNPTDDELSDDDDGYNKYYTLH